MKKPVSSFGIKPLGDRVVLKEIHEEGVKTKSGIIIPDSVKNNETKIGKVVAVGEGKYEDGKKIPMTLKVGDEILYSWGDKIKVKGEEYIIVRESEVSAILK